MEKIAARQVGARRNLSATPAARRLICDLGERGGPKSAPLADSFSLDQKAKEACRMATDPARAQRNGGPLSGTTLPRAQKDLLLESLKTL